MKCVGAMGFLLGGGLYSVCVLSICSFPPSFLFQFQSFPVFLQRNIAYDTRESRATPLKISLARQTFR